jgi:hypothetical protein
MSTADGSGVPPDLAVSRLYAAVVSDILDNLGHRDHTLDPAIRPLSRGEVIAGPANPFLVTEVHRIPAEPYTGEITIGRALAKASKEHGLRDALEAGSTLRAAYARLGVL